MEHEHNMSEETSNQDMPKNGLDLEGLASFQFGPAWARKQEGTEYRVEGAALREREERGENRNRRDGGERNFGKPAGRRSREGRPKDGEVRNSREDGHRGERGSRRNSRGNDHSRLPKEAPVEPTPGLRVELRPADILLSVWATEVNNRKRVFSLFDLAKLVMSRKDRYDLVYMRQEDGPHLIQSKRDDRSCWLTREEAARFIWRAPWFGEFYQAEEESVEPPKGDFKGIAKCRLSGDLIGPVNWHGYQSALLALHRMRYASMPIEDFRRTIEIEKDEEVIQQWLESASKRTVWKPVREGAEEVVLTDQAAVEKDFLEHHFDDVFAVCDKVFVNGSIGKKYLSPGLWAHLTKLADTTRKHPSMLIPNLCHGFARHHMPIFKWKGGHHTGPSRPRSIPEGTVLADNMAAILNWVKEHSGKRVDVMLNELGGVLPQQNKTPEVPAKDSELPVESSTELQTPADESAKEPEAPVSVEKPVEEETTQSPLPAEEPADATPSEQQPISEEERIRNKHQELVRDTLWLCEQGYVLIFAGDGTICVPK